MLCNVGVEKHKSRTDAHRDSTGKVPYVTGLGESQWRPRCKSLLLPVFGPGVYTVPVRFTHRPQGPVQIVTGHFTPPLQTETVDTGDVYEGGRDVRVRRG